MSDDLFRPRPTRREFLALGAGVFALLALPVALRRRYTLVRRSFPVMGTVAEVQVAHANALVAEQAIDQAIAALRWVERTMTRFRADSDIGRVNLGAAREGVVVSAETGAVIARALEWSVASDGAFDPAIGATSVLWDVANRHAPPPEEQVHRLAGRGLWRHLDVARHAGGAVVRFDDPDVQLDLGGIAKGFGIDRAVASLRAQRIAHALVTVGGDLYCLGPTPDGDPWRVGIRDPHRPGALAGELEVADLAVTTSGDYERFFTSAGVRYHHLMDPATGAPRRSPIHSVTVQGATCMDADAAATAVFGMPADAARRVARRLLPDATVISLT